ncbi:MAG: tripartite tricarboxylate transporter TctB family protein [Lachnospirales bacterium]
MTSKQLVSVFMLLIGITFAYIGYQLGFWNKEPLPGFFPCIISIVMILASIAAFYQTLGDEKPEYNKNELMVIAGGSTIIIGTFIVGLIPMVIIYIVFWLKIIEKTNWKNIFIILAIVLFIVLGIFVGWLQIRFPWGLFEILM